MGNPLVRFRRGTGEQPKVWLRCCGTAGKPGGKQRRQSSAYSHGRPRPTRQRPTSNDEWEKGRPKDSLNLFRRYH